MIQRFTWGCNICIICVHSWCWKLQAIRQIIYYYCLKEAHTASFAIGVYLNSTEFCPDIWICSRRRKLSWQSLSSRVGDRYVYLQGSSRSTRGGGRCIAWPPAACSCEARNKGLFPRTSEISLELWIILNSYAGNKKTDERAGERVAISLEEFWFGFQCIRNIGRNRMHTSGVPQSHSSSPSRMPFPQAALMA